MRLSQSQIESMTFQMQSLNFQKRDRTSIFDAPSKETSKYIGASLSQLRGDNKEVEKILTWLNNPKAFLFVYGIPGKGKTHFCSACFEKLVARYGTNFRYFSEDDFYSRIKSGWERKWDSSEHIKNLVDTGAVIYDDLGSAGLGSSDWRKEMIGDLVDTLYRNETPTLIVSNYSPTEIKSMFGDRTASRIFAAEGTVVSTETWPDWRNEGK